jgi:hypothetical protein
MDTGFNRKVECMGASDDHFLCTGHACEQAEKGKFRRKSLTDLDRVSGVHY